MVALRRAQTRRRARCGGVPSRAPARKDLHPPPQLRRRCGDGLLRQPLDSGRLAVRQFLVAGRGHADKGIRTQSGSRQPGRRRRRRLKRGEGGPGAVRDIPLRTLASEFRAPGARERDVRSGGLFRGAGVLRPHVRRGDKRKSRRQPPQTWGHGSGAKRRAPALRSGYGNELGDQDHVPPGAGQPGDCRRSGRLDGCRKRGADAAGAAKAWLPRERRLDVEGAFGACKAFHSGQDASARRQGRGNEEASLRDAVPRQGRLPQGAFPSVCRRKLFNPVSRSCRRSSREAGQVEDRGRKLG